MDLSRSGPVALAEQTVGQGPTSPSARRARPVRCKHHGARVYRDHRPDRRRREANRPLSLAHSDLPLRGRGDRLDITSPEHVDRLPPTKCR